MSGWRLAIDFGTSNTAAAHRPAGTGRGIAPAEALALSHQGNLLPSAVFVEERGFSVGHVALNQAEARPEAFLPEPKRTMGADTALLGGERRKVADVVAAVLGAVLDRARRFAGGSMADDVVLTHPEAWGRAELMRLIEGAERAGIERRRLSLVSEPRAATYWYSSRRPLAPGQKVAVFDLGGGTLDVAVLTPSADGSLQVIAARGDNSLGGRTLDARIRTWVEAELEENDTELLRALRAGAVGASLALDRSIRTAKEILSEAPRATITVAAQGRESTLVLTRGEFEELIKPDVDRALDVTRATLLDAGLRPDPSTPLYLTGGSARIPYIQNRLGELAAVATLDDPKTVVSRGALMGPTRRADDVAAGVTTWLAPGAVAGGAGAGPAVAPVTMQAPPQARPQSRPQRFAAMPAGVPSSSAPAKPAKAGNPKAPLIAVGAIAGLLIVGGGAWALTSGGDEEGGGNGGGNGGGATTSTAPADPTSAAANTGVSDTAWPSPRLTDNDAIKAEVQKRLPLALVANMNGCQDTESGLRIGLDSRQGKSYLCGYSSDEFGSPIANIFTEPDDVTALKEYAEYSGSGAEKLSDADGKRIYLIDSDSFGFFLFIDDDPAGSYVYRSGHFDDAGKARGFLEKKELI